MRWRRRRRCSGLRGARGEGRSRRGEGAPISRQDSFDRILQSLHAAAFGDARWPAASGLIDESIGANGTFLVIADGATQNDVLFAQLCSRGERHRELEREYYGVYYPIDERLPRIRNLPDSRLTPVRSLSTEAERKTSVVYNELLPRMQARDGLTVCLDGPDASRIVWTLGDPVDRDGWTSERVETIGRLLPHLRQFVRVRHALAGAGALGASLVELLDNVRAGVIQLDRRARLIAANDRARALLRRSDGLRDEDGHLRASLPEEDAALQKLLARAVPFLGGPGEGGSMLVSRSETRSRLVLHVSPVRDSGMEPRKSRIATLVLAVDPADRAGIDPGRVGKTLGLTRAESRIAVWLAQGKTIDDIAVETGRSRTTVKWHIRHIYAELGVSRQIELAQLVTSLADVPGVRG